MILTLSDMEAILASNLPEGSLRKRLARAHAEALATRFPERPDDDKRAVENFLTTKAPYICRTPAEQAAHDRAERQARARELTLKALGLAS